MPRSPKTRINITTHTGPIHLYTLHDGDFERILKAGQNTWKDIFLCTFPLGIPLLLNAAPEIFDKSKQATFLAAIPSFSGGCFINALFGIFVLVLAFISGIAWWRNFESLSQVVANIKKEKSETG